MPSTMALFGPEEQPRGGSGGTRPEMRYILGVFSGSPVSDTTRELGGVQMSYAEQWDGIAVRIRGLASAGELYLLGLAKGHMEGERTLVTQCKSIVDAITAYDQACRAALPSDALAGLQAFLGGEAARKIKAERDDPRAPLVWLAAFETEMSHILSGRQELIRVRSERAFLHLQWFLAVHRDLREQWREAYEGGGEVSCEQLGAVHLLLHGIHAFKAHTPQARTDLVFNEAIAESAARGRRLCSNGVEDW